MRTIISRPAVIYKNVFVSINFDIMSEKPVLYKIRLHDARLGWALSLNVDCIPNNE